jgi:ubiquinone/menaquinone biosynthesis C-methylase UbiE
MIDEKIGCPQSIDYFEKALQEFLSNPAVALWRAMEARLISQILFQPPVLDLGCGDGSFAKLIQKEIGWGVDLSASDVEKAKGKGIYQQVLVANALELPFEDHKFGTVLSNCVLEHIEDLDRVLDEIARVLIRGGLFVCTVPSEQFSEALFLPSLFKKINSGLAQKYAAKKNARLLHYHCYNAEVWRQKLAKRGIKVTAVKSFMPPRAEQVWDFVDELFLWGIGPLTLQNILIYLERHIPKKYFIRFYYRLLKRYYRLKEDNVGGGLLIVGTKE